MNQYTQNAGLGALLAVESQIPHDAHNLVKYSLAFPRNSFLAMLRLNVWGIASMLRRTAFFYSDEVSAQAKEPNLWWDVQRRWRNGWYNLGGSWSSLEKAIFAGADKKPLLPGTAPGKIQSALKDIGITGLKNRGIGDLAAVTAAIAAATPVIVALTPLILALISLIPKKSVSPIVLDPNGDMNQFLKDQNDGDGETLKAGAGLIGLAALAAIYFGTMSKK